VNDNSCAIYDRLQSAGAEIFKRGADKIDNRSEFGNLAAGSKSRKFPSNKIDNQRSGQIDPT
jgi:hypothetical protein